MGSGTTPSTPRDLPHNIFAPGYFYTSPYTLVLGVILARGVHILSMQLPFMQDTLRVQPVDLKEWLLAVSLALTLLMVMEIFKLVTRK